MTVGSTYDANGLFPGSHFVMPQEVSLGTVIREKSVAFSYL